MEHVPFLYADSNNELDGLVSRNGVFIGSDDTLLVKIKIYFSVVHCFRCLYILIAFTKCSIILIYRHYLVDMFFRLQIN